MRQYCTWLRTEQIKTTDPVQDIGHVAEQLKDIFACFVNAANIVHIRAPKIQSHITPRVKLHRRK